MLRSRRANYPRGFNKIRNGGWQLLLRPLHLFYDFWTGLSNPRKILNIAVNFTSNKFKNIPKGVQPKHPIGDMFGEIGFFTDNPRVSSIKSIDFVYVYKLVRKDFIVLLHNFGKPKDIEMFHNIKNEIEINKNYRVLGIRCYGC